MATSSYKDLIVWQKAVDLVEAIYILTSKFPREEIYGLSSQMRRSAVSIPSNIAEGRHRGTKKDYLSFLRIAYSSGAELETQLIICKRLDHLKKLNYETVDSHLDEIMRMLNAMIRNMNPYYVKANAAKEASEAK